MHLNEVLAAAAVNGQPGMPTVLCGDLNDGPDAITRVLLEGPADGDVNRPDKGDAVRLYNLGRRLPPPAPTPASTKAAASSSTTSLQPATSNSD